MEFALFQDHQHFQTKSRHSEEWRQTEIVVTDKQIVMVPDPLRTSPDSIAEHDLLGLSYGLLERVEVQEGKKEESRLVLTLKDSRQVWVRSAGDRWREV